MEKKLAGGTFKIEETYGRKITNHCKTIIYTFYDLGNYYLFHH